MKKSLPILITMVNPTMVSKKNGTRRICIDYIDLDKACLKNNHLICKIVHLVDAISRDELLTFITEYVG